MKSQASHTTRTRTTCMLNPASKASSDQLLSTPMGMYVLADVCVLVYARAAQQHVRLIQGAAQQVDT